MDPDRRRDLGQSDSPGEKPESGQGVCTSARADNKWFGRWFRRFPVSEQLDMNRPTIVLRYFDIVLFIRTGGTGVVFHIGNFKTGEKCGVRKRQKFDPCL